MKYAIKVLSKEHGKRVIDAFLRSGADNKWGNAGCVGNNYYVDIDNHIDFFDDFLPTRYTVVTLEEFEKTLEPKNEKELRWSDEDVIEAILKARLHTCNSENRNAWWYGSSEIIKSLKEKKLPESWDEYFKSTNLHVEHFDKRLTALRKLELLRKEYVGDWVADWNNGSQIKYSLVKEINTIKITCLIYCNRFLSFPTKELATKFLSHFKQLIEESSPFN